MFFFFQSWLNFGENEGDMEVKDGNDDTGNNDEMPSASGSNWFQLPSYKIFNYSFVQPLFLALSFSHTLPVLHRTFSSPLPFLNVAKIRF